MKRISIFKIGFIISFIAVISLSCQAAFAGSCSEYNGDNAVSYV